MQPDLFGTLAGAHSLFWWRFLKFEAFSCLKRDRVSCREVVAFDETLFSS